MKAMMIKAMMMMMEDSFVFLSWSNDYSDDLCRIRLAERLHLRLFIHRIHIHINHTGSITPTFGHPFHFHRLQWSREGQFWIGGDAFVCHHEQDLDVICLLNRICC